MNEIPNIGGGVIPNGVINNANPIANKQINANGVPQIGINDGPRIIPTIDPPVIRDAQQSVIRSLSPPVIFGISFMEASQLLPSLMDT